MTRSPLSRERRMPTEYHETVMQMQLEHSRDEFLRAKDEVEKIKKETGALQDKIAEIKKEIRFESQTRKTAVAEEEVKAAEKKKERHNEFTAAVLEAKNTRKEMAAAKLQVPSNKTGEVRELCGNITESLQRSTLAVKERLADAREQVSQRAAKETDTELARCRKVEAELQVTVRMIPEAERAPEVKRAVCQLSEESSFELPDSGDDCDVPVKETIVFVPVRLARALKWVRHLMN